MPGTAMGHSSGVRVVPALVAVYVLWGSTYPAIRVMVETVPPLLGTGLRYVVAGTAFALVLAARGRARALRVTGAELAGTALVGVALVAGGTGLVAVGEQDVPSGLASLIFASAPLWVVALRRVSGERVTGHALGWVFLGFAGVAVLLLPGDRSAEAPLGGLLILLGAAIAWACGSFLSPRLVLPTDPLAGAALQMVVGGLLTTAGALIAGEGSGLGDDDVSAESMAAFAYLVTAGTLAAYTAYVWLLKNAPVSRVMTFAYVNPVVAIVIGWLALGEQVTPLMLAGALVVLASVAGTLRSDRPVPAAQT
jgi:drug/metabolite transporter (DMT)-like permease